MHLSNKQTKPVVYHERSNKNFSGADQVITTIEVDSSHYVIVTVGCEFLNANVDHIRITDRTTADIIASLNSFGAVTAVLTEGTYDVHIKTTEAGANPFVMTKVTYPI